MGRKSKVKSKKVDDVEKVDVVEKPKRKKKKPPTILPVPSGRGKKGRPKAHPFLQEEAGVPLKSIGKSGVAVYDERLHSAMAYNLCAEHGLTYKQLARVFGVSHKTIESWKSKYPAFKKACKEGSDAYDTEKVEQMLLKRALGFEYQEKEVKTIKLRGKRDGAVVYIPAEEVKLTTKFIAPESKAAIFWLTNRNKERWQMVNKIEMKSDVNKTITKNEVKVDLAKMSVEQLKAARELIATSAQNDGANIPIECGVVDETNNDETLQIEHFQNMAQKIVEGEILEEEENE